MKISDELYRDERQLCHDKKWQNNETNQDNVPAKKFSMLRRTFQFMTRPRQILYRDRRKLCRDTTFRVNSGREEDYVATKKFYVMTKTT